MCIRDCDVTSGNAKIITPSAEYQKYFGEVLQSQDTVIKLCKVRRSQKNQKKVTAKMRV